MPVEEACAAVLQILRVVESALGGETVLPVLRIVKCLFGLYVGLDGPRVGGMEGVRWVEAVSGMGRVEGVA